MNVDRLAETRARRALQGIGQAIPESLVRASSTRNEVHVAPRQVVRVNCTPDKRLRREALLCRSLPDKRYFPTVLGYAGETGFDFVVIERKPGVPVARAWPTMDQKHRRYFIKQFAEALKTLHSVPTPPVATKMHREPASARPCSGESGRSDSDGVSTS